MVSAQEALKRLKTGNRRFSSGSNAVPANIAKKRLELLGGQHPFAIILGCSDSRVPPEIVFDQGLGDLFVVRVAGNIAAPSQVGSIEFAVEQFDTRLVVVLGHSQCGAIAATVAALQQPTTLISPGLRAIVDRIRPSLEGMLQANHTPNNGALIQQAVRANVRATINWLQTHSPVIERFCRSHHLLIVGAEYDLKTRVVEFFDDIPDETMGHDPHHS